MKMTDVSPDSVHPKITLTISHRSLFAVNSIAEWRSNFQPLNVGEWVKTGYLSILSKVKRNAQHFYCNWNSLRGESIWTSAAGDRTTPVQNRDVKSSSEWFATQRKSVMVRKNVYTQNTNNKYKYNKLEQSTLLSPTGVSNILLAPIMCVIKRPYSSHSSVKLAGSGDFSIGSVELVSSGTFSTNSIK